MQSIRGHRNTYTVMPFIQKGKKLSRLHPLCSGKMTAKQRKEWVLTYSGRKNPIERAQRASETHLCAKVLFWSNRFDLKVTILIRSHCKIQSLVLKKWFGEIPRWPWTLLLNMILNLVSLSAEIPRLHQYIWVTSCGDQTQVFMHVRKHSTTLLFLH